MCVCVCTCVKIFKYAYCSWEGLVVCFWPSFIGYTSAVLPSYDALLIYISLHSSLSFAEQSVHVCVYLCVCVCMCAALMVYKHICVEALSPPLPLL